LAEVALEVKQIPTSNVANLSKLDCGERLGASLPSVNVVERTLRVDGRAKIPTLTIGFEIAGVVVHRAGM
jgi:hypothetical protein